MQIINFRAILQPTFIVVGFLLSNTERQNVKNTIPLLIALLLPTGLRAYQVTVHNNYIRQIAIERKIPYDLVFRSTDNALLQPGHCATYPYNPGDTFAVLYQNNRGTVSNLTISIGACQPGLEVVIGKAGVHANQHVLGDINLGLTTPSNVRHRHIIGKLLGQ